MTDKKFRKEVQALFDRKIAELLERIARLQEAEEAGGSYRKVRRKGYRVRAHNVQAHWMYVPVGPRKKRPVTKGGRRG